MTARTDFRFDIQFLRGVAVLLVVIYHAFEEVVPKGYLGVDIFFVISGFLVTTSIVRELEAGTFTLRDFYLRRVRRIVPALLSTLLVTTLAAHWILLSFEWDEYLRQLAASILFSANLLLSRRDGYFGPLPETEPLRHLWSLAVEEQFYLLIPLLLMALPARWRMAALAVIGGTSLVLCIVGAKVSPILTFYNLPTRAWEFIAGALCGFGPVRAAFAPSRRVCWLAVLALIAASLVGVDELHPRGDAIIIVAATALILLSRDDWLPRNFVSAPVVRVGDWSYSLYLVHWPILSFVHLAAGQPPTWWMLAGALLLSLGLAALQYRTVELPFWRGWTPGSRTHWWNVAAMLGSLVLLAIPAVPRALSAETKAQARELSLRKGFPGCADQAKTGLLPEGCSTGPDPKIAIWGDSYVTHLIDGILTDPLLRNELLEISSLGCPPVTGFSPLWPDNNAADPARCILYNEQAVSLLARSRVRVVLVSSPFGGVLADDGRRVLLADGTIVDWHPALADEFVKVVNRLRSVGKQVVIVAPPPRAAFDIARCHLQLREGLLRLGSRHCSLQVRRLGEDQRGVLDKLPAIAAATGSILLLPSDVLCSNGVCSAQIGGRLLYLDAGHLTEFGSIYVNRKLGLNPLLRKLVAEARTGPPHTSP